MKFNQISFMAVFLFLACDSDNHSPLQSKPGSISSVHKPDSSNLPDNFIANTDTSFATRLTNACNLATAAPQDTALKIDFFTIFPANFEELEALYDYKRPLYGSCHLHLNLLSNCDSVIETQAYLKKIIYLCLGGRIGQAYGEGRLQLLVIKKYEKYPFEFSMCLHSQFNEEQIKSFFDFFFYSLYPEVFWLEQFGGFPESIESTKDAFPGVVSIAKEKYRELVTDRIDE